LYEVRKLTSKTEEASAAKFYTLIYADLLISIVSLPVQNAPSSNSQ
jgi:hypothetical protein